MAINLDSDDTYNIKAVVNELIDSVVTFNNMEGRTGEDFANFLNALDYARLVVGGVIYKHGIDPMDGHDCNDHDHDDDGVE